MKKILLASAAVVVLSPLSAQAEDNYYVSGAIGYSFAQDFNGAPSGPGPIGAGINVDFDSDIAYTAAIGYSLDLEGPLDPRFELEYSYREQDIDQLNINGNDTANNGPSGGDFEVQTFLVNAIVDYDLGNGFKPYVGVGVGVADVEANGNYLNGGGVQFNLRDSDTVFAAQGIAGASYEVTQNIEFFGDARYLATSEAEFERVNALGASTDHDGDFNAFSINTGIRYKF